MNWLPVKPPKVYVASEKLRSLGINDVEWCIKPGVELEHITITIYKIPHDVEGVVIDEAVLGVVWSGNEAFNRKGDVRDKTGPEYKAKDHVAHLVKFMERWRHCIFISPGDLQCWGFNPKFDDIM